MVEALNFAKPVVSSNVSSLPEVVGDAGIVVDPLSTGEIAAAIMDLCSNPQTYKRYQQNALERSRLFSWKNCSDQTRQVIDRLATI